MPIQIKRGNQADLVPGNLLEGEPAYTLDTKRLVVGDGEGGATQIPTGPEVNAAANTIISSRLASKDEAEEAVRTDLLISPKTALDQAIAKSAAIAPTIGGNATTRDLTVPAGTNPNRLTLLLTSATTATSAIRLRVGTGTYYNIVMPTGSGTDNVLSLSAYVPYDLILANIGGTLRYVCTNYLQLVPIGSSNGWYYKRSQDGFVTMWRTITATGLAYNVALANLYGTGTISVSNPAYPFTFLEVPTETALARPIDSPPMFVGAITGNTTTTMGEYRAMTFWSGHTNKSLALMVQVIGRTAPY